MTITPRIFLDDVEVTDCFVADEEKGLCICYAPGTPRSDYAYVDRYGKVRIEYK